MSSSIFESSSLKKSAIAALVALMSLGSACTNSRSNSKASLSGAKPTGTPTTGAIGKTTYKISSINITNTSSVAAFTLFFETTGVTDSIRNHCTLSSSSASAKPCACNFTWQEVNTTGGDAVPITRTVQTALTNVQDNLVACPAPAPYNTTEIAEGTVLKITVVPFNGNGDIFVVNGYNHTKGNVSGDVSFQDAEGRAFQNIFRYSCYEQFKRGMTLKNKLSSAISNPNGGSETRSVVMANQFCLSKADGSSTTTTGCEGMPAPENSAQSYYYNLYIRATDKGGINAENSRYVCPRIQEALGSDGSIGSSGQFYPLDTTFALSMNATADFNVAVEAPSRISVAGDSTTTDSACYAKTDDSGGSAGSSGRILKGCLGFASKPNSDGTCPYIRDANNQVRLTYRLRRFVAVYPPTYDTTGDMVRQAGAVDTVLVLDRPVRSTTADPLKPFTMRGPKPCPFAFFDHKRVLGSLPQYAATNFSGWSGTNIDGIEFPNIDDASTNSCSAVIPVVNKTTKMFSLGTVNSKNPVLKKRYVRPIQAFSPHYEEDTDFQACAPQSDPMSDPPLHFSKDPTTGNVAWCAETYPTQNNNVGDIDVKDGAATLTGQVVPFTSHYVKNAVGADCSSTTPTIPSVPTGVYPSTGTAYHPGSTATSPLKIGTRTTTGSAPTQSDVYADKTCDRTVVSAAVTWPRYPLLARSTQTEDAIASDSTYGCILTYDGGGSKTGAMSPKEGCCGTSVRVWTGRDDCTGLTCNENLYNTSAHLEPTSNQPVPCQIPTY